MANNNWDGLIDNAHVYGLDESIRAAKYPMSVDVSKVNCELTPGIGRLAQNAPGTGHNNFLSGIVVQFDLTCTIKMWTEFERYHFAQIVSSQSTMHRITRFDLDTAYIDYVDPGIVDIMKTHVERYNALTATAEDESCEADVRASARSDARVEYLRILYSNPCGMKLTARISTNYLQLKTMYNQRKDHRLPEWRAFCDWVRSLPHSEFIVSE